MKNILHPSMYPNIKSDSVWFQNNVKINEPALRAYLINHVPRGVEVDDIIQETYARIIKVKLRQEIESPKGLMFTIAKNIIRDIFRKKHYTQTVSLVDMENFNVVDIDTKRPDENAEFYDNAQLLERAIQTLPKKCQKIFLLRHFKKLSYKEISKIMNVSNKTIENQLVIAKKKCEEYFRACGVLQ